MITDDRETILQSLISGDIFHAECSNGASLICLAISISASFIEARTVTTQHFYRFSRSVGSVELDGDTCAIDSVTPLPVDIHNVMLGIDRKFRLTHTVEGLKLDEAEKQALIFADSFYAQNRLPALPAS